jgi:NAD+ synthase (glutamine-hydrolysing)
MRITYEQLSLFRKLRQISRYGSFSMFKSLIQKWQHRPSSLFEVKCTESCTCIVLSQLNYTLIVYISQKVKSFFTHHSLNRHKIVTLTPSVHVQPHSIQNHRFDLRTHMHKQITNSANLHIVEKGK